MACVLRLQHTEHNNQSTNLRKRETTYLNSIQHLIQSRLEVTRVGVYPDTPYVHEPAASIPSDYVLAECTYSHDKIHRPAAAFGVYDAYDGFIPCNWGQSIAEKKDDEGYFDGLMG